MKLILPFSISVFVSAFSSNVKLDSYFHSVFIYLLISRMSKHHFRIVNLCKKKKKNKNPTN